MIGPAAFVLRYAGQDGDDRLLLVNLGGDLVFQPAPEPLLAPPVGRSWSFVWSSDAPRYGGPGVIEPLSEKGWLIPGGSAAFYATIPCGKIDRVDPLKEADVCHASQR